MIHQIKEPEFITNLHSSSHKAELISNYGIEYAPENFCFFISWRQAHMHNPTVCVDKLRKRGRTITFDGIFDCDVTPDYLTPFAKNKII